MGSEKLYDATESISKHGIRFMPATTDAYFKASLDRVKSHYEPLDHLKKQSILVDGEDVIDGGGTKISLQIFPKTVIWSIFFEFIQRKVDDGFGEGNFKALFELIEEEQIANDESSAAQSAGQAEGDIFPTLNVTQFALSDGGDFAAI